MGYNPKQIAIGNAYWDNEATRDAAYQFFKGLALRGSGVQRQQHAH